jgi:3-isopropylmalate/(R)-2-methylmalate dehydratase small subunit
MRFDDDKKEIPSFVLNKDPYRTAQILISGENFGCGSSREHAPWALLDFGFRCIIAPSFADIFYNNCFKNGILPIALPHDAVDQLMDYATNTPLDLISIDLPNQRVTTKNGLSFAFDIDSFKKTCLLEGLDDIGLTLAHADHLKTYEANNQADKPWLWG